MDFILDLGKEILTKENILSALVGGGSVLGIVGGAIIGIFKKRSNSKLFEWGYSLGTKSRSKVSGLLPQSDLDDKIAKQFLWGLKQFVDGFYKAYK